MSTTLSSTHVGSCHECSPADIVSLERTRFFPRQLVGPDDLTQDQVYFREKQRRHNRLLHGWGIVCGAGVKSIEGSVVEVSSGYVLGPFGDDIVIPEPVRFDVGTESAVGALDCGDVDPWCADRPQLREDQTGYLAVRYAERATRPVTVTACGCGCDESACEYSRTRDAFELAVLTELPPTYRRRKRPSLAVAFACAGEWRGPCPPCPDEPWVILADVTISGGDVTVDCSPHRRYVASFADFWFMCAGGDERTLELEDRMDERPFDEGPID
jgi:hypothetical protein